MFRTLCSSISLLLFVSSCFAFGPFGGFKSPLKGKSVVNMVSDSITDQSLAKARTAMIKAFSLGEMKVDQSVMIEEMKRNNYSLKDSNANHETEMSVDIYRAMQTASDSSFKMNEEQRKHYRTAIREIRKAQGTTAGITALDGSKGALIAGGLRVYNLQDMVNELVRTMREIHYIDPDGKEIARAEKQLGKEGSLAAFGDSVEKDFESQSAKAKAGAMEKNEKSSSESLKEKLEQLRSSRKSRTP